MLVARTLYLMVMSRRLGSSSDGVGVRLDLLDARLPLAERLDAVVRGEAGGVEVVRRVDEVVDVAAEVRAASRARPAPCRG